jgi:arylsulfatase A-like enzyme
MIKFCLSAIFAIGLGLIVVCSESLCAAKSSPNFIFILSDDQRFDALGANGNKAIHTPNLDRVAARGVRFSNSYVVMSLCSPSRAAILTGRYGSANGVTALNGRLNDGEKTFAESFKDAGYRTAFVGKWHLENKPEDSGFDYHCYFHGNGPYFHRQVWNNGKQVKPAEHVDEYCVEQSTAFLEKAAMQTKPFVLFHATQLPHMDNKQSWPSKPEFRNSYDPGNLPLAGSWRGDLTGKPPYLAGVRNRTQADSYGYDKEGKIRAHIRDYYAVVTEMDDFLGRLFVTMDRLKLWENTWLIFASDNGWLLGEHRMTSKVLPYDPSIRVPMFIVGPGLKPHVEKRIALNIDLAPTLLNLAGIDVPKKMHGRSLVPLLREEKVSWRDSFIYECIDSYGGTHPMLGACTPETKLIQTWDDRATIKKAPDFLELYGLKSDPEETNNLAGNKEKAEIQDRLSKEIARHLKTLP